MWNPKGVFRFVLKTCFVVALFSISELYSKPSILLSFVPDVLESKHIEKKEGLQTWEYSMFSSNLQFDGAMAVALSGEHSQTNGVLDQRGTLYPEKYKLTQAMQKAGYECVLFSDSSIFAQVQLSERNLKIINPASGGFEIAEKPVFYFYDVRGERAWENWNVMRQRLADQKDDVILITVFAPSKPQFSWKCRVEGPEDLPPFVSHAELAVIDLANTILAYADLPLLDLKNSSNFLANEGSTAKARTVFYFRYWSHLADGETPAHFGVRLGKTSLTFFYGVDYQEPVGPAEDDEEFLKAVSVNRTEPYWSYQNESIPLKSDFQRNLLVDGLKEQLRRIRLNLGEEERNYPHIAEILEKHWDDAVDYSRE